MRLQPSEQPLLDENVELPALAVAPGPPHPRGGRGSFSSSYSSGVDGTDSSCSFSSSRIFDESGGQEVDLDELSSESSRGDYALLSMPVESVKRLVATSTIISRSTGSRIVDRQVDTQDSSIGQAARYPGIAGALRELREGRVAIDNVEDDDEGVLFQEERQEPGSVELRKLILRLSTRRDLLVLAMGLFAALIHGGLWSLLAREVHDAVAAFAPYDRLQVDSTALFLMLLSLALGVTAYTAHLCLSHTAERQLRMLREQVLRHLLLDLDQSWFDTHTATVSSLGAELTKDANTFRQGLGPELGAVCRYLAQFISSFAIAFLTLWDVALAVSCMTPAVVSIVFALRPRRETSKSDHEVDAVAFEALSNMRTLLALNAQRRARDKHAIRVRIAEHERTTMHGKYAILQSLLTGGLWAMSAVGLWYGGKKVYEGEAAPSEVLEAFVGILIGSHALGHLLPSLAAVIRAKRAASTLFALLETPSRTPNCDQNGVMNVLPRPAACSGALVLVDVHFSYSTRPERLALRGCNLSVAAGECVAVVGDRGAGKSTLVSLLLRLYEPSQGLLLVDGREMTTLDVTWMRAQMGVVTQDLTLFRASIYDNIAMGLVVLRDLGGRNTGQVEERVINAAQRADVHEFIMSLPEGYHTRVGENGAIKLSNQQRQRIALARALIREPKLLLLDEVALSPQELLSRFGGAIGVGSTTMILFTRNARSAAVQYADKIAVLEAGEFTEHGTHTDLLQRNSSYRRLYVRQGIVTRERSRSDGSDSHQVLGRQTGQPPQIASVSEFTQQDMKALCRPERKLMMFGLVASMVVGFLTPLFGLLISEMVGDMVDQYSIFLISQDVAGLMKALQPLVTKHGYFLSAGGGAIIGFQSAQLFCLDVAAERVSSILRDLHFSSLLAQPLSFFDSPQHTTKALTKALAAQSQTASLAIGRAQGYKLQIVCTLMGALAVAFWRGSWMLTLVLVAAFPLLVIGETIHTQQQMKIPPPPSRDTGIETEDAVEVHTSEALRNREAVVTLGLELSWCSSFETLLQRPLRRLRHKTQLEAVARGFCAVVMVAASALACWLSGVLVNYGDATFRELVHSLLVVTISALSLGIPIAWLGGTDDALQAGSAIYTLRDAANAVNAANGLAPPPSCDSSSEGEQDPIPQSPALRGSVALHNIHFSYPARPNTFVLDGLSLHIEAGQTVALCGLTGAGKSTVLALIERFYELLPAAENGGRVLLDGVDTRTLDMAWMRTQVGFVGSEPTLFYGTIAENIAYGMAAPPSLETIIAAAEVAHAHAFISRLPDGYATRVGGELQFSPGQRQRITLARSVLQDPRLLLLDEPTRYLGAESEKMAVQQALDTIVAQRVRRTTVIAAHPAQSATVRNADTIFVLDAGRVVDQGTHSELLEIQNGIYARLVQERAWSSTSSSTYTVGTSAT